MQALAYPLLRPLGVRVIKLGGSLLEWRDLRSRFECWMKSQAPALNFVIVGGGELVEAVRHIDQRQTLDAAFTHWLCIDLMATTAKIAAELLGLKPLISSPQELGRWLEVHRTLHHLSEPCVAVVQPSAYYYREGAAPHSSRLPEDWSCTSDSIAAWLATCVNASELVLLKSTSVAGMSSKIFSPGQLSSLAELGLVDSAFPEFASGLANVQVVNLRDWS